MQIEASDAGVTGDYNNNGMVDAADYVVWRNKSGTTHVLAERSDGRNDRPGAIHHLAIATSALAGRCRQRLAAAPFPNRRR